MSYQHVDADSLQLIIELQLGDLESALKGKHRQGEVRDGELAMEAFKSELEGLARFQSDLAMSQSMSRAVVQDGDTVASFAQSEEQACLDRAQALSWDDDSTVPLGSLAARSVLDEEMLQKLKALYVDEDESHWVPEAESSAWAAQRGRTETSKETDHVCTACGDAVPFFNVARCPCSHEYCRDCLAELFRLSITDESLYPPRCCRQPIPLGFNKIFLPSEVVREFQIKEIEYRTPNRTYCHRATCSEFIPADTVRGDVATCTVCRSRTCTICKGPFHEADCPEDTATLELLQIAEENGWQRCRTCHRMVELDTGCNHMSKSPSFVLCREL